MPDYRVYLLNAQDRIEEALLLTCDDDEQAIAAMAIHTLDACGAELWLGQNRIYRVPPKGKPAER